jgi:DNA invertase Pin-like site-specific DNA recombinase
MPCRDRIVKPAVAYARVSTKKQGDHGLSLGEQMVQIDNYAAEAGYEIVARFEEAASATDDDSIKHRPKVVEAILYHRKHSCPIIVASADRFSRNLNELDRLARKGTLNVLVADLGVQPGHVIFRSHVARAQHESAERKERTAHGRAEAKKRGVKSGNPRIAEARILATAAKIENAKERRTLFEAEILTVESEGAHTAKEIYAALNERGFKNPSGGLWTEQNVYSTRRRNRLIDIRESSQKEASDLPLRLVLGADGKVTAEDTERLRLKMQEQGASPATIERIVAKLVAKAPSEVDLRSVQKFMNRPTKMVEESLEAL